MFEWLVVLLVSGECLGVDSQTVRYAEKRLINTPGLDYAHQQFVSGSSSPGLAAYSDFAQKTTEQPVVGELPKNIRTIIVTKKVPVPYPVHVQKNIPYPIKVPVRRPYTVYVPRPYYVEVMKQVPVPVKVPFPQPYTVEKHVPVPYKVHYDKPYPVHVSKPYPVFFDKRVPIHIEKPVAVPYKVPVDRPYPVHIPVEKQVLFPVERPYPFSVKVPVEKPVAAHKEKPISVPVTVEKPHYASNENSGADYYSSTQPTIHNTFAPSQYDEITSTLITQGKHKVMSFLPGSQNNLGSYGDHTDIGTIHVSEIKGVGGNSTDWVPKQHASNHQYLTYIPNIPTPQPKYTYQYISPEKTTKLNPVINSEPLIVKHNSVKMHYKLHFDPVKQEYSFQLMPRPPGDIGSHGGYNYQSLKPENKPHSLGTNEQRPQYVYKQVEDHSAGSENLSPTKPNEGPTYSFQHVHQGNPEFNSIQSNSPGSDPQTLTYSYQNQHQGSKNYQQESAFSFQTETAAKSLFDISSQVSGHQPEVSYTYESVQPQKQNYQQEQMHNSDQSPQITYSYSIVNNAKLGYDIQPQLKNAEMYPSEQVRYMYIPQGSDANYAETRDTSNLQSPYSISTEPNYVNTEHPQVLYQQGRVATIMSDQYGSNQPTIADHGKIPENFKSSRASEDISLYEYENKNSSDFTDVIKDQSVFFETDNGYRVENVHPFNDSIEGEKLGGTSSITFQKFGVADVMTTGRTKLYPVNETTSEASLSSSREKLIDPFNLRSDYTQESLRSNYFQQEGTASTPSEYPLITEVYRLPSYKLPKSKKGNRRRNNKDVTRPTEPIEDHTQSNDEDKTTTLQWYEMFTKDAYEDQTTRRTVSTKETNSHTGAAERAPFSDYHTTTATTTTTTSNSLQPPDDASLARPTQSIKRQRGSVKAFGRKKEEETATEVIDVMTTKVTRRRRKPGARRRSDRVTKSPTDDAPV